MPIIDATNATAAYGQVGLWDAKQFDYPSLRGERVAASDRAVAVAVPNGPAELPTRIEVWTSPTIDVEPMTTLWCGVLLIGSSGAKAGG